jgi:DNA-binding MarR family transcriptional regulator
MDEKELRATAAALRRSVGQLARRLRVERDPGSVGGLKLAVLGHLHRRGPMTPGDLASMERVQPQSLTRALASLQHEGLVSRSPARHDRRRHRIAITSAGRAAVVQAVRQRDAWLARAMRGLTGTECELLRVTAPLLARLGDADHETEPSTAR